MSNPFRNESLLKIAGKEFLLRPTFEAIATLESHVGSLSDFAITLSKGRMPKSTDMALIVFHCQFQPDPKDKVPLAEIWDLVLQDGITIAVPILEFITKVTAGDKTKVDLTENQKKS